MDYLIPPMAVDWRHVIVVNWPIRPEDIRYHVPDGLVVETFDESAWVSLVAVYNHDFRLRGAPRFTGMSFPQVNLRTYVNYEGQSGVYFFSLDAQGIVPVIGARILFGLPYYYARVEFERRSDRIHLSSSRYLPGAPPAKFEAAVWPTGKSYRAEPDTLEHFVAERRRVYSVGTDGTMKYLDIHHPPWTLYRADGWISRNTLFAASGIRPPDVEPTLYYSRGVDVVSNAQNIDSIDSRAVE